LHLSGESWSGYQGQGCWCICRFFWVGHPECGGL